MSRLHKHSEFHRSDRIGWLRASVLGANDGIVSTASLIVGVASAGSSNSNLVLIGVAGIVAGAMSMAAGEYVSVSSQADTEKADLARESLELLNNPESEHNELANIYISRGVDSSLAHQLAKQLMNHDALGSHAREELGITEGTKAKPFQAAFSSAASFTFGAILPLIIVLISPAEYLIELVSTTSLLFLIFLGMLAAKVGGSNIWLGAFRVGFWGALAMILTAWIGSIFG